VRCFNHVEFILGTCLDAPLENGRPLKIEQPSSGKHSIKADIYFPCFVLFLFLFADVEWGVAEEAQASCDSATSCDEMPERGSSNKTGEIRSL